MNIRILYVLFFFSVLTFGQKYNYQYKQIPLKKVLKDLEQKHNIRFSYADKIITNQKITLQKEFTLEDLFTELTFLTQLYFQKISDTQYNIIPLSETKSSELNKLEEVLIQSYITSGIDRNNDGSLDVTSERLGILPGLVAPDIAQSVQLIPGISTLDESATGIQIRGGSPDQNLILFDGIKLYNTGYFYGMFSAFNPAATQSARIFKSGTSAAYGERISGIIDISTGNEIPKKIFGGAGVDGLTVDAFVKAPLTDKLAIYFFGRRSHSDIWESPTHNSYADKILTNFGEVTDINGNVLDLEKDDDFDNRNSNHDLFFTDINSKVIYKPNENNSITISSLFTKNTLNFDFTGGDELVVDSLRTTNKGLSFQWNSKGSKNSEQEILAYYSEYNSYYENKEIKDETGDGIRDLAEISIRSNDIVDLGIQLKNTTEITENQKLTLGYQLSHTDLDVTIGIIAPLDNETNINNQDNENLKNALFTEYTYFFKNNKGLIHTGLRFAHYNSLHEFVIEPRMNFEYALTDKIRWKTAIERRNQPISQLVEFNHSELRLENNLWRLSDDTQFPLLTSHQISGGILYHHKKLNIDIDSYYKELDGLTTLTNGFSNQLGISNNPIESSEVGKSTIVGLDVLLRYKWENYKFWAGYTYNDITFEFPNLVNTPSKFPGNNDITHQFRASATYKLDNWQFSLGWQFRTGNPVTPINSYEIKIDANNEPAGVVNFGSVNSGRLPDFHRLDSSIIYNFHFDETEKWKGQLGLSFLNIYNRVVPLNYIYKAEVKPLDDGGIPINPSQPDTFENRELILEQVIQRFSLGFTPNLSFRVWF